MASKRRPGVPTGTNPRMNYRPPAGETSRNEAKGSKPLPEPASVGKVLLMMVIHVCRKALFVDTSVKVGVYGACLFILSLLADVLPVPKSYLARSDNVFNQYFVKLGWGWTLIVTLPFLVLTSFTYCCGHRDRVGRHLIRLGVATGMWYFWTGLFSYIEVNYGRCYTKLDIYDTKKKCLEAGQFWNGLDLSGHAFILVYSSLVIIEEARAISGWEGIQDMIRNEEYSRNNGGGVENSPLRNLSANEFYSLKDSYERFTPFVRALFIGMTLLTVLWDVMLVGTILYHHIMIEKFISGAIAILMWFFTYRFWYSLPKSVPCLPGDGGLFKYRDVKAARDVPLKKRTSMSNQANQNLQKGQLPRFMGMPLVGLKSGDTAAKEDNKSSESTETEVINPKWLPKRQDFFETNA